MIQRIGKYHIVARIGRGGMGEVFKAHDPILDRTVALKVISNEVEVTDELRARFFREAQACARLSHPNIVTVYDMGEEAGRLYFVMEFLAGDELRLLIAQRRFLPIEDALALMIQVCDGLHYAHQKGIVHRDIKPGNIILLANGTPKILDFGIAQMSAEGALTRTGLTRTGLIMGTLRYISPEQARGHVDHRSDMFSLGAVFYELLGHRPAFPGDDVIQILERLRSEDPPPLSSLDPTVPPELDAVIARALHKDPSQRFPDLADMRAHLEDIQHQFGEEARRARERVQAKLDELRQLYAHLAEAELRVDDLTPRLGTRSPLKAIELVERDVAARLARAQDLVQRVRALRPGVERGLEHLRAGRLELAISELGTVVREMPEHAGAAAALREAQQRLEAQGQRRFVEQQLDDAREALDRGALTMSLEMLNEARETAQLVGMIDELDHLHREVRQREERRGARRLAETAQATMSEARALAVGVDAARRAPSPWTDAETDAAAAAEALAREDFPNAQLAADRARRLFRQSEQAARNVLQKEEEDRFRRLAESAHEQAAETRVRPGLSPARTEGDADQATVIWPGRNEEAAADQTIQTPGRRVEPRPSRSPLDLVEGAHGAKLLEPARHELSTTVAAPPLGPSPRIQPWALAGQHLAHLLRARAAAIAAALLLIVALALYFAWLPRRLPEVPRRNEVIALQQQVATAHQAAVNADAARLASAAFTSAANAKELADRALSQQDLATAHSLYTEALTGFRSAAAQATDAVARLAQKVDAEGALQRAAAARTDAEQLDAIRYAPNPMQSARARERQGHTALDRGDYLAATLAFREAEDQYRQAIASVPPPVTPSPPPMLVVEISQARKVAADVRSLASRAGAEVLAKPSFDAGSEKWMRAENSTRKGEAARALGEFKEASRFWEEAARRARATLRDAADGAREAHARAVKAQAELYFKDRFEDSLAKLSRADDFRKEEQWAPAVRNYREVTTGFTDMIRGVEGVPLVQAEANITKKRRAEAISVGADRLAKELFESAAAKHVQADRLSRLTDVQATLQAYKDAAEGYGQAVRRALDAGR